MFLFITENICYNSLFFSWRYYLCSSVLESVLVSYQTDVKETGKLSHNYFLLGIISCIPFLSCVAWLCLLSYCSCPILFPIPPSLKLKFEQENPTYVVFLSLLFFTFLLSSPLNSFLLSIVFRLLSSANCVSSPASKNVPLCILSIKVNLFPKYIIKDTCNSQTDEQRHKPYHTLWFTNLSNNQRHFIDQPLHQIKQERDGHQMDIIDYRLYIRWKLVTHLFTSWSVEWSMNSPSS